MLVVSRKPGQKIVIPSINATIQVVATQGRAVKLGIDAPREVQFLRDELLTGMTEPEESITAKQNRHRHRNILNSMSVGLNLLRRQIEAGVAAQELNATILRMLRELPIQEEPAPPKTIHCALLVEDDPSEREMLASVLRLAGIEVIAKSDGIDALDYLRREQQKPDVVLLDMGLPDIDGSEIIHTIKEMPEGDAVVILVVSGRDEEESVGVDHWFRKPIDPDLLIQHIKGRRKAG